MEVTADDIKEAFHAEKILELKSEKNEDMEKNLDTVVNAIETIGYFKEIIFNNYYIIIPLLITVAVLMRFIHCLN